MNIGHWLIILGIVVILYPSLESKIKEANKADFKKGFITSTQFIDVSDMVSLEVRSWGTGVELRGWKMGVDCKKPEDPEVLSTCSMDREFYHNVIKIWEDPG